jgi:hypothetical protein
MSVSQRRYEIGRRSEARYPARLIEVRRTATEANTIRLRYLAALQIARGAEQRCISTGMPVRTEDSNTELRQMRRCPEPGCSGARRRAFGMARCGRPLVPGNGPANAYGRPAARGALSAHD